ncbi:MAG: Zn-dependent oligopeptidase, partial [Verrucomicrobia bacterium]|nr:Zn-dependent oligopeptidase [Verrucomicrobiota bacterium]
MRLLFLFLFIELLGSGFCLGEKNPKLASFAELQRQAAQFHSVLSLPPFETSPEEIQKTTKETMETVNKALDCIGAVDPAKVSFRNTVVALDDIAFQISQVVNRISVLREAHPDAKIRDAAIDADQTLGDWIVSLDYRPDVYRSVHAFAETHPDLKGEDRRLLEYQLLDYRRAGLDLPNDQQQQVEAFRKELSRDETIFEVNLNNAATPLKFSRPELDGVPDSFMTKWKKGDDLYVIDANVTFQALAILDNAIREDTRRKVYLARDNRARARNLPLLKQVLRLRSQIAEKLGYKSWADYRTEDRMARNGETALNFLEKLSAGLQPKYQTELDEFKRIKAVTGVNTTQDVNIWDVRFCSEQLRQQRFNIDAEALRIYFPYEKVLQGMFDIYQRIFSIRIQEVNPPYKYEDNLRLFAILDKTSGAPLGMLYLDMFPRLGKFNHFANFSLVDGKLLEDGNYQRPTTSLICNFPPPVAGKPSLMTHDDVTTLFHEFGHAMHSILTEAKYVRFSGTNVPRDFVEAPSQMLEYFTWDKNVLDSFAADYRDPAKKIPQTILTQLKAADLATKGTYYRRQLSFGILDLKLHSGLSADQMADVNAYSNQVLGEVFLAPDPSTAQVASFGHLMGYDAGYYGYAWADAIAADMASVFQSAPDGFLDEQVGRRL